MSNSTVTPPMTTTSTPTSTTPPVARPLTHPIMGSSASLLCLGARHAEALDHLDHLERTWSRFLPDSDISQLNRAGGRPTRVHPDTIRLLEHLALAWRQTGGDFDPTMLRPLVLLGYAQSRLGTQGHTELPGLADSRRRPEEILLDRDRSLVALPAGMAIDPGGLGKGLAADMVVERLQAAGDTGPLLIEIGGDLRVAGSVPSEGFIIDVWDPERRAPQHQIALGAGGVATSSTLLRTWVRRGVRHHHLLDPHSQRPAAHGVIACTVIAGTAAWAEALTKVAFAHPAAEAIARLSGHGVAALVTTDDGTEHHTPSWKEFLR